VQAVGSGGYRDSAGDRERGAAAAVIQDLLELREELDVARPDEDSLHRQLPFDPLGGDEQEHLRTRLTLRLAEVEREVQGVAERHREILEREAPSEARALELASGDAYVELAARPVLRSGSPAGEESTRTRYELHYDRVARSLDEVIETLISHRSDFPPGSLLDVEA